MFCYADVVQESDGTFAVYCYCGWCDGDHATEAAAKQVAYDHEKQSQS